MVLILDVPSNSAELTSLISNYLTVIHFTLGYEAAAAEIKHVLAGQDPQTQNKNSVGTNDYSKPPRAVVLGRGLTPSDAEELRKTCAGINKEPVAWLVGDPAKAPTVPVGPEYGERVARESKNALDGWVKAGGINDGVIVW